MISQSQRRMAGQVAWERDLQITNWPTTPRGVSALIQSIKRDHSPAPVVDWQLDAINERLERAVVEVEGFNAAKAFAQARLVEGEMPTDRTAANIMIRYLDEELGKAEFTKLTNADLSEYVAKRDSDEAASANRAKAAADSVVEPEDTPF